VAIWSNWSGRLQIRPERLHFVRSEADAQGLVVEAAGSGGRIRVAGSGHSHAPLVPEAGIIVDTSGLAGVAATSPGTQRARIWAGTKIYALGRPLHDAGLALRNQGDIDRQSIGGACATGTHGTGATLQNLSAAVMGARIVLASGDVVECSATQNVQLWQAARLSLGAVGLITQLELQLRDAYCLQEQGWEAAFDDLLPQLSELVAATRHFEFFWYPDGDTAIVKRIDETDATPRYPLSGEGARTGWSYEVLPNHRPHLHTEMEYSVPADRGPECMAEIRRLVRQQFPEVRWPVEYRTLAADDVWLSTAYQRPSVTISVHQDVGENEEPFFRACEEVFLGFEGRPHWGKVHYLDGTALAAAHPRWEDWWRAREEADPGRLFLNDYLRGLDPSG
jgi:FAD/FMN-containing dehydrogenase